MWQTGSSYQATTLKTPKEERRLLVMETKRRGRCVVKACVFEWPRGQDEKKSCRPSWYQGGGVRTRMQKAGDCS